MGVAPVRFEGRMTTSVGVAGAGARGGAAETTPAPIDGAAGTPLGVPGVAALLVKRLS